jgi:hypothetical protein
MPEDTPKFDRLDPVTASEILTELTTLTSSTLSARI